MQVLVTNKTLHHLSSNSAVKNSSVMWYSNYDPSHHPSSRLPSQNNPNGGTSCVSQDNVSQRNYQNHVNTLGDHAYAYPGNHEKLDSIYTSQQSSGYYYDTHKSDAVVYRHRQTNSSIRSHSNENMQDCRVPFMDRSTSLPCSTMNDIPGTVESESSSLDHSVDSTDSAVPKKIKSYDDRAPATSNRNLYRYRNDNQEDHVDASR